MCVCFYSSFVCVSAYANVYFKTTKIKPNIKIILNAGVPSSQALLGFLITAPPSVCVSESTVLGVPAVWIQNQEQKKRICPMSTLPKNAHISCLYPKSEFRKNIDTRTVQTTENKNTCKEMNAKSNI